jgi:hypothetical protein
MVKTMEQDSRITDIDREIGGRRAGVGWVRSSEEAE